MRLWRIHPQYLDQKGLADCWNEALDAQEVLAKLFAPNAYGRASGVTTGVHPQLTQFTSVLNTLSPLDLMGRYLSSLYEESLERGCDFDLSKLLYWYPKTAGKLSVSLGQARFEMQYLAIELKDRNGKPRIRLPNSERGELPTLHPLFLYDYLDNNKASWEKDTHAHDTDTTET